MADRLPALDEPDRSNERTAPKRAWTWGGLGFAGLAAVAAALLFFVQEFSGLQPTRMPPVAATDQNPPRAPEAPPELLELSASVNFGRLTLEARRDSADVYTAVGLIDAKGQRWLVQSGEQQDPACTPGCGPLELRVKLDALAPGPVGVGALMSGKPIRNDDLGRWLPDVGEAVPQSIGARGFGAARLVR